MTPEERALITENEELRRMLFQLQWQPQDYTDDGEMQSQAVAPYVDFKRGSLASLQKAIEKRRKDRRELEEAKVGRLERDLRTAHAALQAAGKAFNADDKEELKKLLTQTGAQEHAYQIVKRMERAESELLEWYRWAAKLEDEVGSCDVSSDQLREWIGAKHGRYAEAEARVTAWRVWVSNVIGFDHVTTDQTDQNMRDSLDKRDNEATETILDLRKNKKHVEGQVRHLVKFIKRMADKEMISSSDDAESGVLQEKAYAIDSIEIKSEPE